MKLLTRRPQLTAEEIATLRRIELDAEVDRIRQLDQVQREQAAADRAEQRRVAREAERTARKRAKAKAKARARRIRTLRRYAEAARTVGPLLVVNAVTIGAQLAYVHGETPADWPEPARVAVAIGVATAAESVALYVGWHAHDALLARAYTTARWLRRASYGIAAVMAAANYSHFVDELTQPTALAVIVGVLSCLSPWLWGLHTRRVQHVQLLRDELVDATGAAFDPARRRAFPLRSWAARRWSIDHNVRNPIEAWEGYRAERAARPTGRLRAAWAALLGRTVQPTPATPAALAEPEPDSRCTELLAQMAAARSRLTSGAAWAVRRWSGSAGSRRAAEVPTTPPAEPAEPESAEVPAQLPIPGSEPAGSEPTGNDRAGRGPGRPLDTARLAREYDRLTRELRRRPTGKELSKAAGCGLSTAKGWMKRNRPLAA
ncbi:hypothetical protein ACIBJE_01985 [Micromonospora sp. NPDC050187]|uniref:hypothetical protein n=1 Tax=Micromonospora sp. NPDC050187 TaxID=3364277 RepID=UPI0037B754A3